MSDMSDVEGGSQVGVERGSWKESILQGGVLILELELRRTQAHSSNVPIHWPSSHFVDRNP